MSDSIDPQAGAPPVTNSDVLSAQGKQSARMTGGGPLQWEPPTIEEAARLFPAYEILGLIGRGGMGAVYKARQVALDRLVAIKLLPLEVSGDRDFADRFVREARTMAKFSHPNIITVYDFGTTSEGHLFFVMEFVAGANLHAIIHEVGLDPDQALWLAGEVCAALTYAHGKGVVHRDIKPANVMVDGESHVKVADFGLARLTEVNPEAHGMTMTGMVMGTPDYMAPEQKRGMNVDHRADIYSVGVMLYEMVCREVPQGAFDLPSRRTGCDARLDAIVLKAMQQTPERRYQSTKEMETDVEAARKPQPRAPIPQPRVVVRRPGPPMHVPRPAAPAPTARRPLSPIAVTPDAAKSRTPLYAGGAMVVLGAIVAVWVALQKPKPKHVEERRVASEDALKEKPVAKPPDMKPTPAPIAETPKEQPVVKLPEMKPTPAPVAEPPAANPQNATEKWLAEQEPQWKAAFALDVTAPFEKAAADLKKQYVGALDAQLATATRGGQLTAAVALRDELQRFAGSGAPGEDEATTPVGLKAMRSGYRKNFSILETERAARAKAVHDRYDTILATNQTLLTQRQRFDEALLLKAKREELAAAWLKPSTPEVASASPPTPVNIPASSSVVPIGARIAESMSLYASGNNACSVRINGKELMHASRDKPSKLSHRLHEGDIIAVRLGDRFDINSFWLSCIASNGQLLFETSEQWVSYIPAKPTEWSITKGVGEQKPAQFARDGQEYVKLVKQSASQTPNYRGTQPIRSVLTDGTRVAYVYYVVTKMDLVLKDERKAQAAPAPVPLPVNVPPVVSSTPMKVGTVRIADATKERPFENSLGMRFVPVPIIGGPTGGQRVLFSIWETRIQDFEVAAKTKGWKWSQPDFPHGPTHPAVKVTWDQAQAFCTWLTERERQAGRLGTNERYRLPTDHEWSCAVEIGGREDPAKKPEEKAGKIADVFPWGSAWPPPHGAGNYSGEEVEGHKIRRDQKVLPGYRDDFPYTAPVGSFAPDRFGIFDLGGNVWEWCEDVLQPAQASRVMRGATYGSVARTECLSSARYFNRPETGAGDRGFRVVLAAGR